FGRCLTSDYVCCNVSECFLESTRHSSRPRRFHSSPPNPASAFGVSRIGHLVGRPPRPCLRQHARARPRPPRSKSLFARRPNRGRLTENHAQSRYDPFAAAASPLPCCSSLPDDRRETQTRSAEPVAFVRGLLLRHR